MRTLVHELRIAFRSLRLSPGFMVVTALTLGIAVGATAAPAVAAGSPEMPQQQVPHKSRISISHASRVVDLTHYKRGAT